MAENEGYYGGILKGDETEWTRSNHPLGRDDLVPSPRTSDEIVHDAARKAAEAQDYHRAENPEDPAIVAEAENIGNQVYEAEVFRAHLDPEDRARLEDKSGSAENRADQARRDIDNA